MAGRLSQSGMYAAALMLMTATTLAEPFWGSKPLSHWVQLLQQSEPAARAEATRALAQIALAHGPDTIDPAVPHLIDALGAAVPAVRAGAAAALEQAGTAASAAQPALLTLFERDPEADVRAHAALALTRLVPTNPDFIATCGRVLDGDADVQVRQAAAAALVQAGPSAQTVEPVVVEALEDDDVTVRLFAASVVGQLGQTAQALPVLLAGLGDEDAAVRAEAAGLLAVVAPRNKDVLDSLIGALRDYEAIVRLAAADALGRIGEPAERALQPLWRLIRDPDESVRDGALRAIRRIRG